MAPGIRLTNVCFSLLLVGCPWGTISFLKGDIMLWIITAVFGFVLCFCFLVSEVPPPPSQASSFEEKEVTFVTNSSSKTKGSFEKESSEKTVVPFFSEEEYEELYALQDSFKDRPIRPKPYGKTYGIKWDGNYFIYGVEVEWDQYHLHSMNEDIDWEAFQYLETKKELKNKKRRNNWKKSLRDHRK